MLLFAPLRGMTQTTSDLEFAASLPDKQHFHKVLLSSDFARKRNATLVVKGPYYFYKYFISSQDNQQCSFYPSCANYALLSVEKDGFIIGVFKSLDRLTRCHNADWEHYHVHPNTGKWYDLP
jgi:putative component of membrane protein insertase Oxa1/YidC/SpoIIIJ protein YidD